MGFLSVLMGVAARDEFTPDVGHDSEKERVLAQALLRYNNTTGPLAGGAVVRIIEADEGKQTFGWVNPHFFDPVAVRLSEEGAAEWGWTDSPDLEPDVWDTDLSKCSVASGMVIVLNNSQTPVSFNPSGQTLKLKELGIAS